MKENSILTGQKGLSRINTCDILSEAPFKFQSILKEESLSNSSTSAALIAP